MAKLVPYDGVPKVGERVWWEDPYGGRLSGWYEVSHVEDDSRDGVMLTQEGVKDWTMAFCHELWREESDR